jgi:hypothetical protein
VAYYLGVFCPPMYGMCSMRVLIKFCCAHSAIEASRINTSCWARAGALGDWRLELHTTRPNIKWLHPWAATGFSK